MPCSSSVSFSNLNKYTNIDGKQENSNLISLDYVIGTKYALHIHYLPPHKRWEVGDHEYNWDIGSKWANDTQSLNWHLNPGVFNSKAGVSFGSLT